MSAVLYTYAMTCDSGFAPCVQDGLLSLACCKGGKNGGMRTAVQKDWVNVRAESEGVWVLGLCGKGLAGEGEGRAYSPIYLAKVTDVILMTEYYKPGKYDGRADHSAYICKDGKLESAGSQNPHHNDLTAIAADIRGKYVLLSREFVYWGDKCGEVTKADLEKAMGECAKGILKPTAEKKGIEAHYRGYIVCRDFEGLEELRRGCKWPEGGQVAVRSYKGLSGKYEPHEDENNEDEYVCLNCCRKGNTK